MDPLRRRFAETGILMWTALLATALGVRVLSAIANPVIQRDGSLFLVLARMAFEEDPQAILRHDQHPLFPFLAGLVAQGTGDWELAGLAIAIICGALTTIPIVLIGDRVCGRPAGLLAAWMFACARYPVRFGATVLSDSLHGLLFAAAAWAGAVALGIGSRQDASARDPGPPATAWFFLAAGLLSGTAYLTRPEGLIIAFAVAVGVAVKLVGSLSRGKPIGALLRGGILLSLGVIITGGPYAAYLTQEHGSLRLTRKKPIVQTLIGQDQDGDGDSESKALTPAQEPQGKDPEDGPRQESPPGTSLPIQRALYVLHCLGKLGEAMEFLPAGLCVIGLLAWGLRQPAQGLLPVTLLLLPAGIFLALLSGNYIVAGYAGRRHFYPPAILLYGWVGMGLLALGDLLGRIPRLRTLGPRLALALAVLAVLSMIPKSTGLIPSSGRGKDLWMRSIGLELRGTIAAADQVAATNETFRVGFYSGGRVLWVPNPIHEDVPAMVAFAGQIKARWLITDCPAAESPPAWLPGWSLARSFPHGDREVRVFWNSQ